jgi:signal peptidase I
MNSFVDDNEPAEGPSPARQQAAGFGRALREWVVVLTIALGSAFLIRVFVLAQYYIDGPSMQTTLEPNDRVLVNKLSYRLHGVNRGDVVVFDRITIDGSEVKHDDLIKRVIGLEGETVEIDDCVVSIDGRVLEEPYLDEVDLAQNDPSSRCRIPDLSPQVVPESFVFVMGDNRYQSFDSREFGPIETELIRGRAFVVIWPSSAWRWL